MNEIKPVFLGYLHVLGVEEVLSKLTTHERTIGSKSVLGCFHAIENYLLEEGDADSLELVELIRHREKVNGDTRKEIQDELQEVTNKCALSVWNYYKEITTIIGEPNLKIEEIYAIVATDEGGEGVMGGSAVIDGREMMLPFVGADKERIRGLIDEAKRISKVTGTEFRVYRFSEKEDVTDEFV